MSYRPMPRIIKPIPKLPERMRRRTTLGDAALNCQFQLFMDGIEWKEAREKAMEVVALIDDTQPSHNVE